MMGYEDEIAKLQRDYSHLLKQKQDCEDRCYSFENKVAKLKEEVRILMKGTEVLGITAEQYKSTLDEVKTLRDRLEKVWNDKTNDDINVYEELNKALAKHEGHEGKCI